MSMVLNGNTPHVIDGLSKVIFSLKHVLSEGLYTDLKQALKTWKM